MVRAMIPDGKFIEIFIGRSLSLTKQSLRADLASLAAKGRSGRITKPKPADGL